MERSVPDECRHELIAALTPLGHPEALAEILAKVAELPYDGDLQTYTDAAACVIRDVWQPIFDAADARINEMKSQALMMKVMGLLPSSNISH